MTGKIKLFLWPGSARGFTAEHLPLQFSQEIASYDGLESNGFNTPANMGILFRYLFINSLFTFEINFTEKL